ncbi:RloB family protein [Collinsella tanakaei]|uniref:RloB family protein n=1 Tax=Collinsella tanakaei TaxID=626935 RepID=UPI0025A41B8E|nr:RloB family protein [Collinsella tanakaei]MDM8301040.1 RloB family protein [Collinsella tanakaei]
MARVGRRGAPSKSGRLALCMCVEGETELGYFKGLRSAYHIPKTLLHVFRSEGTAISEIADWLRKAKSGHRRGLPDVSFDQFWGVADTEWKADWKGFAKRADEGFSSKSESTSVVQWAISSASFERWLLLHFEANPPRQDVQTSANHLGKYLPGYSSKSKRLDACAMDKLLSLTDTALANARRWRATNQNEDNFTDVDVLVDVIRKYVAKLGTL